MENNEREYQDFAKWLSTKSDGFAGFTKSEAEFAHQLFEFLEDYPSFRKKMVEIGNKNDVFLKIQQFVKQKSE